MPPFWIKCIFRFDVKQSIFFVLFADSLHQTLFAAISLVAYTFVIASHIWDFHPGIPTQIFFLANYVSVIFSPIFTVAITSIRLYVLRNIKNSVRESYVRLTISAFYIFAIINAVLYIIFTDYGKNVRTYRYITSGSSEVDYLSYYEATGKEYLMKATFGAIVPIVFIIGSFILYLLCCHEYNKISTEQLNDLEIATNAEPYLWSFKKLTSQSTIYTGLGILPFFLFIVYIQESWNRNPDVAFVAIYFFYFVWTTFRTPLTLFLSFKIHDVKRNSRSARRERENMFALEERRETRKAKFLQTIEGPAEGFGKTETRRLSLKTGVRVGRRASQPVELVENEEYETFVRFLKRRGNVRRTSLSQVHLIHVKEFRETACKTDCIPDRNSCTMD